MLFTFMIKIIINYLESLRYIKLSKATSVIYADWKTVNLMLLERLFLPKVRLFAFHLISQCDLLIIYSRMTFLKNYVILSLF